MSTPYTYFRITPGSPAAAVMAEYRAAYQAMGEAASAYATKHIPVAATAVVMNHSKVCGYTPGPHVSHSNLLTACRAQDGEKAWIVDSKDRWFIHPAAIKSRHAACPERLTDFLALPTAPSWDTIAQKLIGQGVFRYGRAVGTASLHHAADGTAVLGIPWLATQGNLGDWAEAGAKLKLMKGLKKMPYEVAFAIITTA